MESEANEEELDDVTNRVEEESDEPEEKPKEEAPKEDSSTKFKKFKSFMSAKES